MTEERKGLSEAGKQVVAMKTEVGNIGKAIQQSLPDSIPADKFIRTVQTAIQMNPDIAKCSKQSVLNACMKAASDGLILDGREAALITFNTKKKGAGGKDVWVKESQYIPMVTGIIKRVRNSGEVARFNAFMRFENDYFKRTLGLDPQLEHEPNDDEPGKALGAYAVCLFKDGTVDYEYMSSKQILRIGKKTKNAHQYDPDKGDSYEEWWRKTVIRRLSKRLPMDSDIRNVVERVDDLYEEEAPEPVIDQETGEILDSPPEKPIKRRRAAKKMAQAVSEQPEKEEAVAARVVPIDADYEEVSPHDDIEEDMI